MAGIKPTMRERFEFVFNYKYECSQDYIDRLKPMTDVLLDKVEILEKALRFYADESNHASHSVESDDGEIAREALKEDKSRKRSGKDE